MRVIAWLVCIGVLFFPFVVPPAHGGMSQGNTLAIGGFFVTALLAAWMRTGSGPQTSCGSAHNTGSSPDEDPRSAALFQEWLESRGQKWWCASEKDILGLASDAIAKLQETSNKLGPGI